MNSFKIWLLENNIDFVTKQHINYSSNIVITLFYLPQIKLDIFFADICLNTSTETHPNIPESSNAIWIWQDRWTHKKQIVKNRILYKLEGVKSIAARDTVCGKVSESEASKFLNEHHLFGSCSSKYRVGLYYKNILVALAAFTWPRKYYKEDGTIEKSFGLARHCTLTGIQIPGGLSKLMSYFENTYKPHNIFTAIDLDWGHGNSYTLANFIKGELYPSEKFYLETKNLIRYKKHEEKPETGNFIEIFNQGYQVYRRYYKKTEV
ncbi:MAG: hypothetical protein U0V72_06235 [Cytophagales bacterium]